MYYFLYSSPSIHPKEIHLREVSMHFLILSSLLLLLSSGCTSKKIRNEVKQEVAIAPVVKTESELYAYENKVLITLHRRDNHDIMDKWFIEINNIAKQYKDIEFILPIHPNPNVLKHKYLLTNINVIEPLKHDELIEIIKKCKFVISDSGGLQEECSFLNKKIIICRKTTERPEVLNTHGILCNDYTQLNNIVNDIMYNYYVNKECPFGDGFSWKKIKDVLNC